MKCKELIRQGMIWSVEDGNDISFWYDNWIENCCLRDLLKLDDEANLNPRTKVSEFLQNKQQNVRKLSHHISNQSIVRKITEIPIPITDIKDSYCWGLNSTGIFSTKSATWLAQDQKLSEGRPWQFKWIWKIDAMPKIKIFLWQMCHNVLPARGTLLRQRCRVDPQCPLCLDDIETIEQLFGECPCAYPIWALVAHHKWISQQVQ